MKIRNLLLAVCLSGVGMSSSLASPVDNQGSFNWSTGSGTLEFNGVTPFSGTIPTVPSGAWNTYIATNGTITNYNLSIASVTVGTYTVQVLYDFGGTHSGSMNAAIGGWNMAMSFTFKIQITGGPGSGVGSNCITSSFVVAMEGAYSHIPAAPPVAAYDEALMYSAPYGSTSSGGWTKVPALGNVCNGHHDTLNTLFNFGPETGGLRIVRLLSRIASGPVGS